MSRQKRIHHVGNEYQSGPSQESNGVKSTPMNIEYWCGKIQKVIVEDPCIVSPEDRIRLDAQQAKRLANPLPECEKCKRAKAKARKWLAHLIAEEK